MKELKEFIPESLLEAVEKFSNKKFIDKRNLLLVFIEGLKDKKQESFERLIFTSKYVLGLKRVLEKGAGIPDVNNLQDVKKDLSENMISVVDILKEFNSSMPEVSRHQFEEEYLKMTPDCLSNLYQLLEGLEWTKMYLNDLKRK